MTFLILLIAVFGFAGLVPDSAAGDDLPCTIYQEEFDSFAGPPDFSSPKANVRWCLSGASIANGGFCNSGTALKLLHSSDRATLRLDLLDDTCSVVTLRFQYSQFVQTGTVVRFGTASTARSICSASTPEVVGILDIAGGACVEVSHTVEVVPGQALIWRFDHGQPTNTAIFIDNVFIEVESCCEGGSNHDCCENGPAGCGDTEIEQCVCTFDPYCCQVEWDAICADLVTELGCGDCDAGAACVQTLSTDFGNASSSYPVCQVFSELFEVCGGIGAPYLTTSGACGGAGDASMAFAVGFPHSYAETVCINLADAASATLQFSYTKSTGTVGPKIDVIIDGTVIDTLWQAPVVFPGGCLAVELDLDAFLGHPNLRLRFSSGSSIANGARIDDINLISFDMAMHGCCEVGEPGCNDLEVQQCVCDLDPFCCNEAWDELCVITAEYFQCADCELCSDSFIVDFNDGALGDSPCVQYPELFAGCFGTGPILTNTTPCSENELDLALTFAPGDQPSAVNTRCITLANVEQASVRFDYSKLDGDPGPTLEVSADVGGTWVPLWTGEDAPGEGCHAVCVDLAPAVGLNFLLFRFRAGSADVEGQSINNIAFELGASCVVPGDVNGDGAVDVLDLLIVISHWGDCPPGSSCPGDANDDGAVNVLDLLLVISHWGG